MNFREYRRWSQRRRAAWADINRTREHRDTEAERLIEFASMWAPYGGPEEDEILVHFGMSRLRFIERLWQVAMSLWHNCIHVPHASPGGSTDSIPPQNAVLVF